ncbi:MAG TPA: peptidylprolyl isomerase [Planctomycetota bacterium]|nr:peptidylprolyl isomerase [Planctomycetota bacterium]
MKSLFAGVALLCAAVGPVVGGTFPWRGPAPGGEPHPATVALRDYTATLRTNLGDIALRFEPDAAPNAVRMFVKLAERGSYDGARIYCVFKDRMVIAGTPPSGAKVADGETAAYEDTPQSVTAGSVLVDRAADGRNCPGRLLIVLADQAHLDGDYTVFAEVTAGLDVAKRIGSVATRPADGSPAPIEEIVIEQALVAKKPSPGAKETDTKK